MLLDITSSLLLVGTLTTVMGLWMLAASYVRDEPNAEELRIWGLSCLIFGIAYALFVNRDTLPLVWSLVVANALYALAYGGFGLALALLFKRPFPAHFVISGVLVSTAALYVAEIVYDTSAWRVPILAAVTIIPWAVSTAQCTREWRTHPSPHTLAMSVGFFTMIAVSLWRIAWSWHQGSFGYTGLPSGTGYVLGSHILLVSPVLLTVGFFLLSAERTQRIIRKLADTDPLTGILNRRSAILLAGNRLASAKRRQQPFSCVAFDLDGLKNLNDLHGHAAGDQALIHLTEVVKSLVRAEDIFGRLGGDEFVVFMPYSDQQGATALAERFREGLAERPFAHETRQLTVTGSFGVATLTPSDQSPLDLLDRADRALYDAKKVGGNAVMGRVGPPLTVPILTPAL